MSGINVTSSSRSRVGNLGVALILSLLGACGSGDNGVCYSPTQNLETAYDEGAIGCPCTEATDKSVCVSDNTNRWVALFCMNGKWVSGVDGPCHP